MQINADYSRHAVVLPDEYQWTPSPQPGVERVMLDRLGGEKARATSIVRYSAGSCFARHVHPDGEEILVLSGTFSEGDQHYPAGWYMRNPPGSSHQPFSTEGALIFVKLRQMQPDEKHHVRIDTNDPSSWQRQDGRELCPLFSDDAEKVCLHRLAPGDTVFNDPAGGAELFVLSGGLATSDRRYERGSWIRLPEGEYPAIAAGEQGATVYVKTGHLARLAALG